MGRQMNGQINVLMDIQLERQTDIDRLIDRQKGRQIDRQTDIHRLYNVYGGVHNWRLKE